MNIIKKKGFTLIEVMIAISVFSIGILAVLQLITRNISVMDKAKQKTLATILAKEGIEMVFNIRDSNKEKFLPRDCVLYDKIYKLKSEQISKLYNNNVCESYFASGTTNNQYLQLGFNPNGYFYTKWQNIGKNFFEDFENNKLYYHKKDINNIPITRYDNIKPGNNETGSNYETNYFARYIVFKPVIESGNIIPLDKLLKVESHVLILKGAYTGEIILESFIGNY